MTNQFVMTPKQKQFHEVTSCMVFFVLLSWSCALWLPSSLIFTYFFRYSCINGGKYQFLEIYQGMFCKPRPILYWPLPNIRNLYLHVCVKCISVIFPGGVVNHLYYTYCYMIQSSFVLTSSDSRIIFFHCSSCYFLSNDFHHPACTATGGREGELHDTTVFTHKKPVFTHNLHFLFS